MDFENGTLISIIPEFDLTLCEMFVKWSYESKSLLTGLLLDSVPCYVLYY